MLAPFRVPGTGPVGRQGRISEITQQPLPIGFEALDKRSTATDAFRHRLGTFERAA
jgi:hypothetical protein